MRCDSACERGFRGVAAARPRRRARRSRPAPRSRPPSTRALLLRGELVELRLLVGGRGARGVGVLLLLRDRVALRVELRLEPGHAARVVLALVVDALEVVLALDQLAGAVGAIRAARSWPRRCRAGRAAPRCAARRRAPQSSFFCGGVGLHLQHQRLEAEPVDGRPARGARRSLAAAEPTGHVGQRALGSLPLGLGVDHLGPGRVLGRAGLVDLLLELLLLVALLARRRGARRGRWWRATTTERARPEAGAGA